MKTLRKKTPSIPRRYHVKCIVRSNIWKWHSAFCSILVRLKLVAFLTGQFGFWLAVGTPSACVVLPHTWQRLHMHHEYAIRRGIIQLCNRTNDDNFLPLNRRMNSIPSLRHALASPLVSRCWWCGHLISCREGIFWPRTKIASHHCPPTRTRKR